MSPKTFHAAARSFDSQIAPSMSSATTASFSSFSPTRLRLVESEDAEAGAHESDDPRTTSNERNQAAKARPESAGIESSDFRPESFLEIPSSPRSRLSSRPPSAYRRSSPVLGFRWDNASVSDVALEDCKFASDRLAAAHDRFLGQIGAIIGLHLQSRTSLDIVATTQRSLEACSDLIAVVNTIWQNDPQTSEELSYALVLLRQDLEQLTVATKDICDGSSITDNATVVRPEEGRRLVGAATACVRSAGDCTAKARELLDSNGDVEIGVTDSVQAEVWPMVEVVTRKPTSLPISSQNDIHTSAPESGWVHVGEPETAIRPLRLHTATEVSEDFQHFHFAANGEVRPSSAASPLDTIPLTTFVPSRSPNSAGTPNSTQSLLKSPWTTPLRKESLGLSATESMSTYQNSQRNSTGSALSATSTRATTPDRLTPAFQLDTTVLNSFGSTASMQSAVTAATDDLSDVEGEVLTISHAHELLFNKDGQILGGTLPALVERLTSPDAAPDPTFVTTFYLTFRLFTTASQLAKALIDRYDHVGDSHTEGTPARLRVYNFIKGWLESNWNSETDSEALEPLQMFAFLKLEPRLPSAAHRLIELIDKASHQSIINSASQIVCPVGRTSVSSSTQYEKETIPSSVVTKSQLALLRGVHTGATTCSVVDLDPLEIARQFTLMESHVFCAIEPQELLNLEWTKMGTTAYNIRSMARFSTDLANLVADSILENVDVRRRAAVVKQWVKIGKHCLDLFNYDSAMAIICSLSSSTIMRLRLTWELVSQKVRTQFDEMKAVVDISRNYAVLRKLIEAPRMPCLPFVGIYLTDLTFVDAGNQNTRTLPSSDDTAEPITVINFDKHMRTARIIAQLQSYQIPYRLHPVSEIQDWLQLQISRVRRSDDCCAQTFWKRSLQVEPKTTDADADSAKSGISGMGDRFRPKHKVSKSGLNTGFSKERFDFLGSLGFKSDGEMRAKLASASVS